MENLPASENANRVVMPNLSEGIAQSASGKVESEVVHSVEELKELYCIDDESGVFRQKDLTVTAVYDKEYVASRYDQYPRSKEMSKLRRRILSSETGIGKTLQDGAVVLDFGCGNGDFVEDCRQNGIACVGYDISGYETNKFQSLNENQVFGAYWSCVTFFDSLEHLVNPMDTIRRLKTRYVMISVPWCPVLAAFGKLTRWELEAFSTWKHRRYGEHIWHFNSVSLNRIMERLGFKEIYCSNPEDAIRKPWSAGHPNILTAIFRKV